MMVWVKCMQMHYYIFNQDVIIGSDQTQNIARRSRISYISSCMEVLLYQKEIIQNVTKILSFRVWLCRASKIPINMWKIKVPSYNNIWKTLHFDIIVSKANRMLGLIKRTCRSLDDAKTLRTLYCTLVRSNVEYCSVVWLPYTTKNIAKVEQVQRRATKFILRLRTILLWDSFKEPKFDVTEK